MQVSEICRRNVVTVRPFDDLMMAARLMRERHIGYVVVVEPALEDGAWRVTGVLTDRDLVVAVVARDARVEQLQVADVMTSDPSVIREEESIAMALQQMRRASSRRLPVINARRQLVGVLSLDDVLEALASQLQDAAAAIRSEQAVEHVLRP